jgi:hypothetical protein
MLGVHLISRAMLKPAIDGVPVMRIALRPL